MPAHGGEDVWELFGNTDGLGAALEVSANGDDLADVGGGGPFDYFEQVAGKIGKTEMGVRIVKNRHVKISEKNIAEGQGARKSVESLEAVQFEFI